MGGLGGTRLIGRDAESALLYDALALAAQGQPQIALVGGDAGIGKTTLVEDLERRARDLGFRTAEGHCLDLGADIPFAPVLEAARTLVSHLDDLTTRPAARRLLDQLGPDLSREWHSGMLDDLRLAVLEAGASGPTLLVLEDLHWADGSTQDFVTALCRTLNGRLLLVLTLRTDELHRRHPVRTTWAEIARHRSARRVDVGRLATPMLVELVESAEVVPDGHLARLVERAEGNPLYAEELAATESETLPEHLSDLLLARVDRLSEGARRLVRLASVDGSRIDSDVLATMSGLDPDQTQVLLREAVEAHVLRQGPEALQFRHGLLREAVYDDLLPDERTRLHSAYAALLQARSDDGSETDASVLYRLAHHWAEAHEPARMLAASVSAGVVAGRFQAVEAMAQFRRALSVWDLVQDAETLCGHAREELMVLMAETASDRGDSDRAHALAREALARIGPDTPSLTASRVYSSLGKCLRFDAVELTEEEAVTRAVALAGTDPTEELARALMGHCYYRMRRQRWTEALSDARSAVEVSREAGVPRTTVEALRQCGLVSLYLGRIGDTIAFFQEGVNEARTAGRWGDAVFETGNLAWALMADGQVDRGAELARSGLEEGVALGLPAAAAFCVEQLVNLVTWQGRFDESDELLDRAGELGAPPHRRRAMRMEVLAARGRGDEALALTEETMAYDHAANASPDELLVDAEVSCFAMVGEPDRAVAAAREFLVYLDEADSESPVLRACAAYSGFRAVDLTMAPSTPEREEVRELAAAALSAAADAGTERWRASLYGVRLAMAEGLAARQHGVPAIDEFRAAVAVAETYGSFLALDAVVELARELLAHGARDEGRELLVDCWSRARAMGAGELERRAFRLATRTRVPLLTTEAGTGAISRLTPREREVLDLIVSGATNRTIAETLVITEKTAAHHVGSVLAKLGVPNRGSAAALVRRG
jgi:DNA-binding CsgD family transcriptional regulator/tetratricopeptide (TPR) repeat protein